MDVVHYFELNYLGLVNVDDDGARFKSPFKLEFWNHYDIIMIDCNFPRTSNMVEGFHRGFKSRVNRPKPSVQEYFRAIREQQVTTDYHIDRMSAGITPSKKRKTNNDGLYAICCDSIRVCSCRKKLIRTINYAVIMKTNYSHNQLRRLHGTLLRRVTDRCSGDP